MNLSGLTILASLHMVFHVSLLKKYFGNLTSIVPLEGLGVNENLFYGAAPIESLDGHIQKLRNKEVAYAKNLWRNQLVTSAT